MAVRKAKPTASELLELRGRVTPTRKARPTMAAAARGAFRKQQAAADATRTEDPIAREDREQLRAERGYRKDAAKARGRAAIREGQGRALRPQGGLVDKAVAKLQAKLAGGRR